MQTKADKTASQPESKLTTAHEQPVAQRASAPTTVRRSLQVGAVDDPYEREADRVASEVVARLRSGAAPTAKSAEAVQRSTRIQAPEQSPAVEIGQRAAAGTIRRLPYAADYSGSDVKSILMASDKRASPVTNEQGHPIQHVGRGDKAEKAATAEQKTKSIFASQAELFKAAEEVLADGNAQMQLREAERVKAPTRIALKEYGISEVDTWVAGYSAKRGVEPAKKSSSNLATMIVDTLNNGEAKSIHIQTIYPHGNA